MLLSVLAGLPLAYSCAGRATRCPVHYIFLKDESAPESVFVIGGFGEPRESVEAKALLGASTVSGLAGVVATMESRMTWIEQNCPNGISAQELFVVVRNCGVSSELIDLPGPIPRYANETSQPASAVNSQEEEFAKETVKVANTVLTGYDAEHTTIIVVTDASVARTNA